MQKYQKCILVTMVTTVTMVTRLQQIGVKGGI